MPNVKCICGCCQPTSSTNNSINPC